MAREGLGFEKLMRIYKENSDTEFFDLLFGSGVPGADAGEQDAAPVGSAYFRTNGSFYQKIASTNATSDWQLNGNGSSSVIPIFKNIVVRAATGEALSVGARDLSTSPFTDDEGTALVAGDFAVGEYIIGGVGGTPVLYEVTAVSSPSITLALGSPALASNDGFVCYNYLPDTPAGQEGMALLMYNGSAIIKLADIDWSLATGINLSGGYTPTNGTVASGDSVEVAIQKLDANQADLISLSGVAQGATDLGLFSGSTIPDNQNTKQALQALETAFETNGQVSVNAITTLATVDSVLVDSVAAVKWYIHAHEDATPSNVKVMEVLAMHNGTAAADASSVKDTEYAILKLGSAFNLVIAADISGTGAAQVMRLRASSTSAGVSLRVFREVVKF